MKKIISILVALACMALAVGCTKTPGDDTYKTETTETKTEKDTTETDTTTDETDAEALAKVDQLALPEKGEEIAVVKTNKGDIYIRFFEKQAPMTVKNFKDLANKGYYNTKDDQKMIFHRVIKDFMIQGGDPTGTGTGGESSYGENFKDEPARYLSPIRGSLAMANRGRGTNGSQFFIVQGPEVPASDEGAKEHVDNMKKMAEGFEKAVKESSEEVPELFTMPTEVMTNYEKVGGAYWLDYRLSLILNQNQPAMHTVFGQVYKGMDIVDAIGKVETGKNDKPVDDIIIESVTFEKYQG